MTFSYQLVGRLCIVFFSIFFFFVFRIVGAGIGGGRPSRPSHARCVALAATNVEDGCTEPRIADSRFLVTSIFFFWFFFSSSLPRVSIRNGSWKPFVRQPEALVPAKGANFYGFRICGCLREGRERVLRSKLRGSDNFPSPRTETYGEPDGLAGFRWSTMYFYRKRARAFHRSDEADRNYYY